jgi:hypothetical protein
MFQLVLPLHECADSATTESAAEPLDSVADFAATESVAVPLHSFADSATAAPTKTS